MCSRKIVMILSGFPRRSETFVLNEILALEERGTLDAIFATKPGDAGGMQPGSEQLLHRVQILPEGSPAEQAAVVVQHVAGRFVRGVHGYFAHAPAEVASRAAEQLGVPYGFSVHARDARKVAPAVLAQRARNAACVIACNVDVAQDIRRGGAQVHLIPHGVDLQRFRPGPFPSGEPLRILAVGRLVEKKGFHFLVAAAARLRFPFHLRIIGEGPDRNRLMAIIAANGLADRVTLCGAKSHRELPQEYLDAHVLAVPSVMDQSGDRDGLPNVVLEAMACGRPVVASDAGAIGSAVVQAETGILVPPGDSDALASTLEMLARQPAMREQLGRRGLRCVESKFEIGRCTERLNRLLGAAYA